MSTRRVLLNVTILVVLFSSLIGPIPVGLAAGVEAASILPTKLLQFTSNGHILGFETNGMYAASGDHVLRVDFVDANPVLPQADTPSNMQGDPYPLSQVRYTNLWDGINLAYSATSDGIYTTTYYLAPGANPAEIRLGYNAPLTLNPDGALSIAFESGTMSESAPIAWQDIDGKRVAVDVAFQVRGQEVGFNLGAYDPYYTLTIDPSLIWLVWVGNGNTGNAIVTDGDGNIYILGQSYSTWGAPIRAYSGQQDAFVARLDPNGNLVWNTFLGSSANDYSGGMAIDSSGNLYVSGGGGNWGSPIRPYTPANDDGWVAKLDAWGNLQWNTFLGGGEWDCLSGIVVDDDANIYVAGSSHGTWGSPLSPYSIEARTFLARLEPTGELTWITFFGYGGDESDLALAPGSGLVVIGDSWGSWGSPLLPYTGYGNSTVFVASFSNAGTLNWNTFLGGEQTDNYGAVAVDSTGNIFVSGNSNTTWGNPLQPYVGDVDIFLARLESDGDLLWNTFLPGGNFAYDMTLSNTGDVYLTGKSYYGWGEPLSPYSGGYDVLVARLTSSGTLLMHTFMGQEYSDEGRGIALDSSGNVFVVGKINNPSISVFVAKFDFDFPKVVSVTRTDPNPTSQLNANFTVTFSEAVTGVDTTDFTLTTSGLTGASVSDVSGSGAVYTVSVYTGTGDGTMRLNLVDDDTIINGNGKPLGTTGSGNGSNTNGQTYSIISPQVRTINRGDPNPSSSVEVRFLVDFSEPVSGVDAGDFIITASGVTGASVFNVTGSGSVYTVVVKTGSGDGTLRLDLVDNDSIVNATGKALGSAGVGNGNFSSGQSFVINKTSLLGDNLVWNSFLGGAGNPAQPQTGNDSGDNIAVDSAGFIYVVGESDATWGTPINAYTGNYDAYVAKLDPLGNLLWMTFLGGIGDEVGYAVAVADSGDVYVAGYSNSLWGNPVRSMSGDYDAFVARLGPTGYLIWSTFLGGIGVDRGWAIALVDDAIFVSGYSNYAWGAPVQPYHGNGDAFLAKLDLNGNLTWNSFVGGTGTDGGESLFVNAKGQIFLTGYSSASWGMPMRAYTGELDGFVAKLDSLGYTTWNTFLGGTGRDIPYVVTIGPGDNIYVAGYSKASWETPRRDFSALDDGFAAKLDINGNLLWNTFLGGNGNDYVFGLTLDKDGNIIVVGGSDASWGSPTHGYTFDYDAFAASLDTSGNLNVSTFMGGGGEDYVAWATTDDNGGVFAVGYSTASWGSPVRPFSANYEAFVVKMDFHAPAVTSIVRASPDPITTSSIAFTVTLSESVIGLDIYDFSLVPVGISNAYLTNVTGSGSVYTVSVYPGLGAGTLRLDLLDNGTIVDSYNNPLGGVGTGNGDFTGGEVYTLLPTSFTDVPYYYWARGWIERLYTAGITSGCGAGNYCPENPVTRAQMAIFLERGMNGSSYAPPTGTGLVFGDVPGTYWAVNWIEKLFTDGITSGCGAGNYCPDNPVTRAQMAIFLLRSKYGAAYLPPAATGTLFADVPSTYWAANWIEKLYAEGVTGGCGTAPLTYCPESPVTRAQMAVFLVRTFSLP
jgi:hypothetical protein